MKKWKPILFAGLVFLVACGGMGWLAIRPRDPLFRGKPESYWIEHLIYRNEEQVKQWREFGPDGVRVLVRGLEGANRPTDRFYRSVYRNVGSILPQEMMRFLPAPRMDVTRSTRMSVLDLLFRLNKDAKEATPVIIRELRDEDPSVRQIAITFFTFGGSENCLLNQMDPGTKKEVLPEFIRAMGDPNWGLRNNAAMALSHYPEEANVVAPILIKALQDPVQQVREVATDALTRIDPAAAPKKQGEAK